MKITKICAENFKSFDNLDINLEGKSTVIFGANGTGKSTILSLLNFCCYPWINRLNPSQSIMYRSFSADLVRTNSLMFCIKTNIEIDEREFTLTRAYTKPRVAHKAVSVTNKKEYDDFGEFFVKKYLNDKEDMPIFVNYGTNRSVLDIPLRIRRKHDFSKLTAIERALEKELDFRTFFEWYRNQEDLENEECRERGNQQYEDKYLKCVRIAIMKMLENVTELKVRRAPLRMTVKKEGMEVRVDQLSDGEKCTLALLGDLARRISLANPNKANPLEGSGIVLIDEIELHMHPSWQRRIIPVLKETFPNIQFIITTHSPQVLGELNDSFKIIKLQEGHNVTEKYVEYNRLDGYDSNVILEDKMGTLSKNAHYLKVIEETKNLIETNEFDRAQEMIMNVAQFNDYNSADVIMLEGMLRRRKYLHDKNNKDS